MRQMEKEFWCRVEKTENCWLWRGSLSDKGYGRFYWNYGWKFAHRAVLEIVKGIPLLNTDEVRHSCDNPPCCNPNHLIIGTHKENMQDMVDRRRFAILGGETNGNSILDLIKVEEIRQKYLNNGISQRKLAREYGVSQGTIWQVVNKVTWNGG